MRVISYIIHIPSSPSASSPNRYLTRKKCRAESQPINPSRPNASHPIQIIAPSKKTTHPSNPSDPTSPPLSQQDKPESASSNHPSSSATHSSTSRHTQQPAHHHDFASRRARVSAYSAVYTRHPVRRRRSSRRGVGIRARAREGGGCRPRNRLRCRRLRRRTLCWGRRLWRGGRGLRGHCWCW